MKLKLIVFLFFLVQSNFADIVLSEVILDFHEEKSIKKDITISNIGIDKKYVSVDLFKVTNPGDNIIKREAINDPSLSPLLVTPSKVILSPGEKRSIRFLLQNRLENEEQILRVRVIPKLGKIKYKKGEKKTKKQIGVKVLVGYDVLAMIRPKKIKMDYKISRKGKTLFFENSGNVNYLVSEVVQCDDLEALKNCEKINGPRVYPGKSKKLELKKDQAAKVILKLLEYSKVEIY